MSENLTEVDSFDANVAVPIGSDPRNAASIRPAFQSLANRTRHLHNLVEVSGVRDIPIRLVGTAQPVGADVLLLQYGGSFTVKYAENAAIWTLHITDFPDGVTLNSLKISIQ